MVGTGVRYISSAFRIIFREKFAEFYFRTRRKKEANNRGMIT